MRDPTADPDCVITARGESDGVPWVEYANPDLDPRRWRIHGVCNRCGSCEVGNTSTEDVIVWLAEPGTPGACYLPGWGEPGWLDNPMTPYGCEKMAPLGCTLTGEWMD